MTTILNKNWTSLIKPSKIVNKKGRDPNKETIIIEPLERGYGYTIGNALRRILLSSIYGSAVTSIKIPGVEHEFTTIPGVVDDLVDIVLNVKSIVSKKHVNDKKTGTISVQGPCVVTASMIQHGSEIEIINPEQVICTVSQDIEFKMELVFESGKGFLQAASKRNNEMSLGTIPIDAFFSPVVRVAYKVEDARVEQITDYDKLVLEVETNGSVAPDSAVAIAARILQDQLQLFINFEEPEEKVEEKKEELPFNPVLLKKVEELELSVRSQNCLKNDSIIYIGDLVIKSESDMLRTPNFGRKSLLEIRAVLASYDLRFGMDIREWPPKDLDKLARKYEDPF